MTTLVCSSCRKPVERTFDDDFQHTTTADSVACTSWPVVPVRVPVTAEVRRCDKALDTASEVCPRCFRQHTWLMDRMEAGQ